MIQVNVHEAKTMLSKLLQAVEAGEEVVVARGGRPVARLVPYRKAGGVRWLGAASGKVHLSADFDAPVPGLEDDFYK